MRRGLKGSSYRMERTTRVWKKMEAQSGAMASRASYLLAKRNSHEQKMPTKQENIPAKVAWWWQTEAHMKEEMPMESKGQKTQLRLKMIVDGCKGSKHSKSMEENVKTMPMQE